MGDGSEWANLVAERGGGQEAGVQEPCEAPKGEIIINLNTPHHM